MTDVETTPPLLEARAVERYQFVDGLRGIAALGVFAHHVFYNDLYGPCIRAVLPEAFYLIFDRGSNGVQVFFVISGFVIAHSLRATPATPRAFGNFILRRHLRLDPPYWVTMFIILALTVVESHLPGVMPRPPLSTGAIAINFFYLQNLTNTPYLLGVAWTLCLEVQFYLLFILLLAIGATIRRTKPQARIPVPVTVALICSGIVSLVDTPQQNVFPWKPAFVTWFLPFWSYFTAGSLCNWALERRTGFAPFLSYVGMFAAAALWSNLDQMYAGLICVLLLFGVGIAGRLTYRLGGATLQYFGRISYSLYLIHLPVIMTLSKVARKTGHIGPGATAFWILLACGLTVAMAHLLHIAVERPTMRLAARLKGCPAPPRVAAEPPVLV